MARAETADQKFQRMTETPVKRLICTLAVPTIISMMVTSIYNMADTFFVGQLGTSATGGVGVAFPLMAIIQAIGFTLGMGSGNYISRLLGQKDQRNASKIAATGFLSALICGLAVTVLGLALMAPMIRMLGATETIMPHATQYIRVILLGAPFMTASFVMNNLLRFQGNAFYAMLGIGAGGILNIALDPLFIFGLGLGTAGAALATVISQLVSFCILLYFSGRNGNIGIRLKDFSPKWAVYREILRGGLPSFYRQGLASVANVLLNRAAGVFGDPAIAALSIVSRVFMFALSVLLGFGQGFQPVCGFNYGAKRYERVLEAFWFCVRTAIVVLVTLAVAGYLFAPQIITLFRRDDLEVISIGARALRFQCLTFPLSSWVVICNMLLQTIGKSGKASLLAIGRQGLFFIPLVFALPPLLGLTGLQLCQPGADLMTFVLAVPLGLSVVKELRILATGQEAVSRREAKGHAAD